MLYKYLPALFYCAIDRYYRSVGLNFRFQRGLRSPRLWFIRYLRLSLDIANVGIVDPVFVALPAVFKQEDPVLLTSFRDKFQHVPSSTHLVSLVFMTDIIF
jgi:hypothetical protein